MKGMLSLLGLIVLTVLVILFFVLGFYWNNKLLVITSLILLLGMIQFAQIKINTDSQKLVDENTKRITAIENILKTPDDISKREEFIKKSSEASKNVEHLRNEVNNVRTQFKYIKWLFIFAVMLIAVIISTQRF
ncbi:MAG: hypothetical protein WBC74_02150 [Candidatus Omnitrophota bacterium]